MRWFPGWPTVDPALQRLMRINTLALALATVILALVYALGFRHRAVLDDLVTMVVALVWMWVSMPVARRWNEPGAVACLTTSTLTFVIGATWVTPTLLPLTAMLTLVPALVGYPFLSRNWVRGLMVYAVLGSSAACFLAEWQRSTKVDPDWTVNAIVASTSMPSIVLVVLYLVAQNHERLSLQTRQLNESRTRVVEVVDAARRGIERDLHDGAQQQLLALSVNIGLTRRELQHGNQEKAAEMLADLGRESHRVVAELRELARGIYPPLLAERGLLVALQSAARRAPIQVTITHQDHWRGRQDVENAAYFCILEAITNAAKYSGADEVVVDLGSGALTEFTVTDIGRGFDTGRVKKGGLLGMEARIGAVGGTLSVESLPGRGTVVRAWLPR